MNKPQKPKPYPARVRANEERRRSNAAGPHRPKTTYRRKPKHVGRMFDSN